ncbi:hypothetical protein ABB37_07729 [Leptomonas pyrrhocoris]|uniref:Uncharacterized protein n=1 Tax=Leptomonas pyrrhocoris TaxID=157538 RepID=A0A0M9FUT3_LEPPY|nr:hypothetical protein ABB37_07729 [Leptomonas pyrrhocoris]KPA76389.1 hypothetical protein ABB37_07729 [Leptomonas pyrrhocoris]|eukprot:XP_015654828.1 hypothetical protein ABB37_07729 [Leptomonas pyrrhocoris]
MKRRALFSSDSDASDDDLFARRGGGSRGSAPAPHAALDDPLLTQAATSDAAPTGSVSAKQRPPPPPPPRSATNTSNDLLPQSSKVASTRRNLSQLFDDGPPFVSQQPSSSPAPLVVPSTAPAVAAEAGVPHTSVDAASHSTFGPSLSPANNAADAFFPPRFTYEGPGSTDASHNALLHDHRHQDGSIAANSGGAAGLTTALHAVVQVYRDALYCGTCMLALCVPPSSVPSRSSSSSANTTAASLSSAPQQLPPSAAARERLRQRDSGPLRRASPPSASPAPILLLMSSNRQVLCRISLERPESVFERGSLQLQQDREQPQYLSFFCDLPNASGAACWWTCMFPDRGKALEFLVATYTVAQYAAALAKQAGTFAAAVPAVRVLPRSSSFSSSTSTSSCTNADPNGGGDSGASIVQINKPATIYWSTWALRRVSRTTSYCLPAECVDGVAPPPSSPRNVTPGSGTLREGLEAAMVGMRSGESRIVFLTAEETRVRHPELSSPSSMQFPDLSTSSSPGARWRGHHGSDKHTLVTEVGALSWLAVAYVTCVNAVSTTTAPAPAPAAGPPTRVRAEPRHAPQQPEPNSQPGFPTASVDPTAATSEMLQQLLLRALQPAQPTHGAPPTLTAATPVHTWDAMERALDRALLQLGSLCEKVDRLDIEGKLQRNNAELERVVKRLVGLAPQEDVAVEDTLKDRDALLASVERYRERYEEANANYQRALEAMGRSSEKAQALEKDLQVQQDLWTRQRQDAAEQTRLKLLEQDVRHREELERLAEERYAAGKSDGHAAGYREGRQAAFTAVDGEGGVSAVMAEWKAKVTARDQQIVTLQAALQDAKFHHERDRRQLRAEIDVLTGLNDRLQYMQANADVRAPEETMRQQCKRVKRTLNSVYSQVEAHVLALPLRCRPDEGSGEGQVRCVSTDDVLAVVMTVIRSEAQSAVAQIQADAEHRAKENAEVRARTLARQHTQRPAVAFLEKGMENSGNGGNADETDDAAAAGTTSSLAAATSAPPLPPPLHTAASRSELAAVAASLLPAVSHVTSSSLVGGGDGSLSGDPLNLYGAAAQADVAEDFTLHSAEAEDAFSRSVQPVEQKTSPVASSPSAMDVAELVAESPVQGRVGSADDAAWSSAGVAERANERGAAATETGSGIAPRRSTNAAATTESPLRTTLSTVEAAKDSHKRATTGTSDSFTPSFPSPSASPVEAASPPPEADPRRPATRLPDVPAPTSSTVVATEDSEKNLSPPEQRGEDAGAQQKSDVAFSFPPSSAKTFTSPSEAAASATAAAAVSPSSDAEDATPPLHNWHSRRLFTTPPPFTESSLEQE